jgi:hypothetical protein
MVYSTAAFGNTTSILGVWQQVSYQTDYLMNILMLLGLWFILFVYLKKFDTKAVMFTASIITTVIAILLFWLQLVTITILSVCFTAVVATLIFERWRDE